jgi:predicted dehydrogenase
MTTRPERAELRFALLGCGDIGILRAAALARTPGCRLTVACDVDATKAGAGARKAGGASPMTDWREAVRRPDVDAVIVSTPPMLHLEMARAAFEAGKHVLCEKPLARTPDECRAMVAAADGAGRRLATGFNYRFYPSFAEARAQLDSGIIGDLDHVRAYGGYSATSHNQPWVHDAGTVGGGALRDIGIHLIDLTRDFLGDVQDVQGAASGDIWKYPGCEDNGFAILRSSAGRLATVQASWTEWRKYQFRIELVGSRGCIEATCFPMMTRVTWAQETAGRTRRRTNWFPRTAVGEKVGSYRWVVVESFVKEFEAFAAHVAGRPSRIATGEDGARAVEIAFAAAGGTQADARAPRALDTAIATSGVEVTSRPADQPESLSVVVLPFGSKDLSYCLEALERQMIGTREVIVVHDATLPDAATLALGFPAMRFIGVPGIRPPAALRAVGAAAAGGHIVAFLEGHCIPAADWCDRIVAAHRQPHAAVGGPIEKGMPPGRTRDTALNWSIYLSDYGRYMLPLPEGPVHSLSDCNVAYKRAALAATQSRWQVEFHENVVNGALRDAGDTLWFDPGMVVLESRELSLGAALRDRFSFGRLFGATRVTGQGLPRRIVLGGAALLMPPLLVWRVARTVLSKGRHRAPLLRASVHLVVVATSWMAGEAVGYVTGAAGRTLRTEPTRPLPAAE